MPAEQSTYLVLPSNASHLDFPANKNNNYKIRLANRLRFEGGKWEIALMDCHYVNNWHNVTSGQIRVRETYDDSVHGDDRDDMSTVYNCDIRKGRYENVGSLIDEIHESLKNSKMNRFFNIVHDGIRDLTFLIFLDGLHKISFSEDLAGIFGFAHSYYYGRLSESANFFSGATAPDVNQGMTSLYVYCSLCASRLVGDANVPLLRVLPIRYNNKRSNKNVYEEVRLPHYVPVSNTDTDVVEIDIRGDDGKSVLFKGGKVCVTVHIRQVS